MITHSRRMASLKVLVYSLEKDFLTRVPTINVLYFLNLSALVTTKRELTLMQAAAIIGVRVIPKEVYKAPAAIGIPITL